MMMVAAAIVWEGAQQTSLGELFRCDDDDGSVARSRTGSGALAQIILPSRTNKGAKVSGGKVLLSGASSRTTPERAGGLACGQNNRGRTGTGRGRDSSRCLGYQTISYPMRSDMYHLANSCEDCSVRCVRARG